MACLPKDGLPVEAGKRRERRGIRCARCVKVLISQSHQSALKSFTSLHSHVSPFSFSLFSLILFLVVKYKAALTPYTLHFCIFNSLSGVYFIFYD
jgi:hypothetical protein